METHRSNRRPVSGRESIVTGSAGSAMLCIALSKLAYHRRRQRLFDPEERRYRQTPHRIRRSGFADRAGVRQSFADTAMAAAACILAWRGYRGAGKNGGVAPENR